MKYLIPLLLVVGCSDEQLFLEDFCEAQGGEPQLITVINNTTGETYGDVYCYLEKDKSEDRAFCKPDNGNGYTCP